MYIIFDHDDYSYLMCRICFVSVNVANGTMRKHIVRACTRVLCVCACVFMRKGEREREWDSSA